MDFGGEKAGRYKYTGVPLIHGYMFQDPQEMPETVESTKPYIFYVFSLYIYIRGVTGKLAGISFSITVSIED